MSRGWIHVVAVQPEIPPNTKGLAISHQDVDIQIKNSQRKIKFLIFKTLNLINYICSYIKNNASSILTTLTLLSKIIFSIIVL